MATLVDKFKRDLRAVLWFSGSIFLSLSLISYKPEDPSLNSSAAIVDTVGNFCGLVGSFISDIMYQGFGLGAWIIVLVLFRLGWLSFRNTETELNRAKALWALLIVVSCSGLLSLYIEEKTLFTGNIYIGGLMGSLLTKSLISVFNKAGVGVLLWSSSIVGILCYTQKPIAYFFRVPASWFSLLREWVEDKIIDIKEAIEEKKLSAKTKVKPIKESKNAKEKKEKKHSKQIFAKEVDNKLEIDPEEDLEEAVYEEPEEYEEGDEDEYEELAEDEEWEELEEEEEEEDFELLAAEEETTKSETPRKKKRIRLKAKVQRRVANWEIPNIRMLEDPPLTAVKVDQKELKRKTELLEDKLSQFSVKGKVTAVKPGPAVTMFEFRPNADVKISKITDLADDLSLALSSESVRIIAPIPGRDVVGIETSNTARETVYLKEVIADEDFWSDKFKLPLALGKEASGSSKIVDLRKMPHLMVAGTTGSGKSVFVVSALTGLLFKHSPETLKLILVDPKQVDLVAFHKVPHLIMPPIREVKKAVSALKWAIREMDMRYRSMSRFGTRNLEEFNDKVSKLTPEQIEEHTERNEEFLNANKKSETYHYTKQPYICVVVEEFGDLMAVDKGNVENCVVRLAQMARASGIHLILAMQSPRKDVVTGLIKTNIPGRISFKVASKMDSRIILDESGAERLLARGDMLYLAPGVSKPMRHHGPWVTEEEITSVMEFWGEQSEPIFDEFAMKMLEGTGGGFDLEAGGEADGEMSPEADDRYDEILAFVATQKTISASFIQRKFRLGYPRAARLIEIFESEGVVGPANGSKPRPVLIGPIGSSQL